MKLELSNKTKKKFMKRYYIILLLSLSITPCWTQDTENILDEDRKQQLGLDISGFVQRFFTLNNDANINTPDLIFLYRKQLKKGVNSRFGMGLDFFNGKNGTQPREHRLDLLFLFGKEYYQNFAKRWRAYAGWEVRMNMSWSTTRRNSNSTKLRSQFYDLSVGPLAGIQWAINSRMSLYTEAFYNIRFSYSKTDNGENNAFQTFFRPPLAVNLNYAF